jgi:hypothetical protein
MAQHQDLRGLGCLQAREESDPGAELAESGTQGATSQTPIMPHRTGDASPQVSTAAKYPAPTRGRIDRFGLQAASRWRSPPSGKRLIDHGASDGTISDFGPVHSIFFRDADGLEGEVLIGKDWLAHGEAVTVKRGRAHQQSAAGMMLGARRGRLPACPAR